MVEYSKNQAHIALLLSKEPKTVKDLRKELDASLNEIEADLAKMIKLKLIQKQPGFPTKYLAIEEVRRGVMEEESKVYQFKAHAIIEGQSKSKEQLEYAQKDLIGKMKKDEMLKITGLEEEEIQKGEDNYSTLFSCDVHTKSFEDLSYFVLNYGPSSLELLAPDKIELDRGEAQGLLMDMANMIHTYIHLIAELKIALDKERIVIK